MIVFLLYKIVKLNIIGVFEIVTIVKGITMQIYVFFLYIQHFERKK